LEGKFSSCQLFQKIEQTYFFNLIQKQFAGNVPKKKPYFDFKCCGMQFYIFHKTTHKSLKDSLKCHMGKST